MRLVIPLVAALLLLPIALPNAAATSTCSGNWVGAATCGFLCDSPHIILRGHAEAPRSASVTVTAECGIVDPTGLGFIPYFTLSCTISGGPSVDCWNMAPNPHYPLVLQGRCTVTGNNFGVYSCSSV